MRLAGMSGTARRPENSRITATRQSVITFTTAPATASRRCRRQGARRGRRSRRPGGRRYRGRGAVAARAALAQWQGRGVGHLLGWAADLFACKTKSIDAAVELGGGRVVMSKEELNPKQPVAPIEFTKDLSCPLLGLFGNEDRSPTPGAGGSA